MVVRITNKQIDAILPFLEKFEADGFTVGTWNSPPGQMPWFSFDETVSEFQQVLYDNGWIASSFKWPDWQETCRSSWQHPPRSSQPTPEPSKSCSQRTFARSDSAKVIWRPCSRMGM